MRFWWKTACFSASSIEYAHLHTDKHCHFTLKNPPLLSRDYPFKNSTVELTVFLAAGDVLGPVAGMGLLVVEQAADAELLRRRPVPARPVARAGRLVSKDPVQPVAVLRALGRI